MMRQSRNLKQLSLLTLLLVGLLSSACSPAAPTSAPIAASPTTIQAVEPSATPMPTATATEQPTATATATATEVPPTNTPEPTATPALALTADGLSGWCLPQNVLLSAASDPLSPPETAQIGAYTNDAFEVHNMPWSGCVFSYNFNQAAPEVLKLEVYEINAKSPWLTADLKPVEGKPEMVSALLTHSYIIDPPFWVINYEFALKDASGTELSRTPVNLYRWQSELCFNGNPPNVRTLRCPLWQDLHPWDAGYGKILPTFTPGPED